MVEGKCLDAGEAGRGQAREPLWVATVAATVVPCGIVALDELFSGFHGTADQWQPIEVGNDQPAVRS